MYMQMCFIPPQKTQFEMLMDSALTILQYAVPGLLRWICTVLLPNEENLAVKWLNDRIQIIQLTEFWKEPTEHI